MAEGRRLVAAELALGQHGMLLPCSRVEHALDRGAGVGDRRACIPLDAARYAARLCDMLDQVDDDALDPPQWF